MNRNQRAGSRAQLGVAVLAFCLLWIGNHASRADVFNMPAGQTSLLFMNVGDAGNAADITGYGAVGYGYKISKYDVTAAQYTQFLNAVAQTDAYGLYNSNMANTSIAGPGISQSGISGSYSYSVISGNENFPVNYLSWGSAARFANWVQNGQPSGLQISSTTEDGAYTLNGAVTNTALEAVVRNSSALFALPSENEWYKAAYYKSGGLTAGYWSYPTASDTTPGNSLPDTGNNANYNFTDPVNYLTSVGSFNLSPGPYGTFDQGGDLNQWTEGIGPTGIPGPTRVYRGGAFSDSDDNGLLSTTRGSTVPSFADGFDIGFRLVAVPEPGSFTLLLFGAIGLWFWRARSRR